MRSIEAPVVPMMEASIGAIPRTIAFSPAFRPAFPRMTIPPEMTNKARAGG